MIETIVKRLIAIQIAVQKQIAIWIASMKHNAISIATLTSPKVGIGMRLTQQSVPIILVPALASWGSLAYHSLPPYLVSHDNYVHNVEDGWESNLWSMPGDFESLGLQARLVSTRFMPRDTLSRRTTIVAPKSCNYYGSGLQITPET